MMKKVGKKDRRRRKALLMGVCLLCIGVWLALFFARPAFRSWWETVGRQSQRVFRLEKGGISPEEKRLREEVILKKMEEASVVNDWREFAPEYPQPPKLGGWEGKARTKALLDTPELKEVERELNTLLRKKEDFFHPEPPTPSFKEMVGSVRVKDKGTEEVMARLLDTQERVSPAEKPLEENLQLGIKGSLASRRIVERPPLPSVRVKVEAEIELTLWVLPNGTVDRVIPSVKGDAELERVAIQYLKQWRFAPLPGDQSQVEQWGTIPVRFRLQ